jgi:uncharacterized membrane protein YecN with MAPEG domain
MPSIHWTLLFAGACGLLQCVLTGLVVAQRLRSGVDFLAGDDPTLLRRIRAHGNFSETAPMALLLMLLLELKGAPAAGLVTMGAALLAGRVLHAASLLGHVARRGRFVGMALTVAVLSLGSVACLGLWVAR